MARWNHIRSRHSSIFAYPAEVGRQVFLRHPPVDTFQQIAELPRGDHHRPIGRRRPYEASTLQLLREQAGSLAIMPDDLDHATATTEEDEQVSTHRITFQRLLHHH